MLLVIVQMVIIILKVVLLVEELVVMVGHLHHKPKEMEGMEQFLLDLVEVEVEDKHHMLQTKLLEEAVVVVLLQSDIK